MYINQIKRYTELMYEIVKKLNKELRKLQIFSNK